VIAAIIVATILVVLLIGFLLFQLKKRHMPSRAFYKKVTIQCDFCVRRVGECITYAHCVEILATTNRPIFRHVFDVCADLCSG